jgi:hypothetical protein
MAYGTGAMDVVQSSTTGTPTQFNDGSGTQIGTLCRAWVNFVGATGVRTGSFNVSSVTRTGTGVYTVNITNAFPDTTGAITFGGVQNLTSSSWSSTSSISVLTASYTGASADFNPTCIAVFR